MDLNKAFTVMKRRAESICGILFYIASGFCFIYYVGNFNGGFMPVIGTLLSMILEVALWLLIPILLAIRRRSIAKWAFLGLSIFWTLTTIFDLLQGAGLASTNASSLACATGSFSFIIACAMIAMAVFAVVAYWKTDARMKVVALVIYLSILLLFFVFFVLRVALYAKWDAAWNVYLKQIYSCIVIPFALLFAALAFWFNEEELHFAIFERKPKKKRDSSKKAKVGPGSEKEEDVGAFTEDEKGSALDETEEKGPIVTEEEEITEPDDTRSNDALEQVAEDDVSEEN